MMPLLCTFGDFNVALERVALLALVRVVLLVGLLKGELLNGVIVLTRGLSSVTILH